MIRFASLRRHAIAWCGLLFVSSALFADDLNTPIRDAISRSIPYLQREGAAWITKRDCLSCHQTSFMVWSLNAAQARGIAIDQDEFTKSHAWAMDWRNLANPASRDKAEREATLQKHSDTVSQLLLGRAAKPESEPDWAAEYSTYLMKGQQADGSWKPGGQLPGQKRPERETHEVSTMWALLALKAAPADESQREAAFKAAHPWLGKDTVGQSTEWWATRLMLERAMGNQEQADLLRAELLKRQREDGGWGWRCEDASDAHGTGIAIYALRKDQVPAQDRPLVAAQKFLLATQAEDGSWPVRGTKEVAKDRIEPHTSFWGTCWAVIGLCETLSAAEPK